MGVTTGVFVAVPDVRLVRLVGLRRGQAQCQEESTQVSRPARPRSPTPDPQGHEDNKHDDTPDPNKSDKPDGGDGDDDDDDDGDKDDDDDGDDGSPRFSYSCDGKVRERFNSCDEPLADASRDSGARAQTTAWDEPVPINDKSHPADYVQFAESVGGQKTNVCGSSCPIRVWAVLGVGLRNQIISGTTVPSNVLSPDILNYVGIGVIALGSLLIFTAVLGCFGAVSRSTPLLVIYVIAMVFALLCVGAAGGFGTYELQTIRQKWQDTVTSTAWDQASPVVIDYYQSFFTCCGYLSYNDRPYTGTSEFQTGGSNFCATPSTASADPGCYARGSDLLDSFKKLVLVGSIVVGVVLLINIIAACVSRKRRSKFD
ncbi:Tetraspanin family-domain-containing protein [Blyttiomyces helicus]|uniref:Tetraspanin family-domain-containing protein n=1 Tax=Blyttiomyces helicus TaxID=388810 RepID=A0A4P9W2D1_9FUNG|nr:Tetraspanin family-domain-containing protein [Blyttiomyces helicus]|eukprot:RKO85882.1 Tetraspanin family-domain-containing protein [Blyttiomyces helicus]